MPRPPRSFASHIPVHLVHRGNDGHDIFTCAEDFGAFKYFLKGAADRHQVAVNAYVLMTNHVHLLLTPNEPSSISKTMHSVSSRYANYFNKHHDRTGMLWQERFFATNITREHYLFACYRYIETNPVRAGMVVDPASYPWSSHKFHALGADDSLVTPHSAYLELSADARRRQAAYRGLFGVPCDPTELDEIRDASLSGRAIGTKARPRGRPRKEIVRGTIF
jgi:putative transposase